ncbi:MAG: hypothetical protein FJ271_16815 [Planctomycetes bacterium]|nr:hypothetical protein [Planctomycetota bacterium]
MIDDPTPLANFSGTARLFPLPHLVLFPNVMQPLHIFEPRYRQMTADALAGDRLIAMALLQPGWEGCYDGRPDIFPVACLGRIVAQQPLPEGRFNILLRGLSRVLIDQETCCNKLYRQARVQILDDACLPEEHAARRLRRKLVKLVPPWFAGQPAVLKQFRQLLRGQLSLSALCDIISFVLPLDICEKQTLLEELNVEERCRHLLHCLETNEPPEAPAPPTKVAQRKFPPDFSSN